MNAALQPGDQLAPFRIASVDPEAMKVWARALRDANPLHLDRDAVRDAGLGDLRINQGPANLAYVINMLTAAFPGGRISGLDVRFVDNVFEGDALEAGGAVTAVEDGKIHLDIWLRAQARDLVIKGVATVETAPA